MLSVATVQEKLPTVKYASKVGLRRFGMNEVSLPYNFFCFADGIERREDLGLNNIPVGGDNITFLGSQEVNDFFICCNPVIASSFGSVQWAAPEIQEYVELNTQMLQNLSPSTTYKSAVEIIESDIEGPKQYRGLLMADILKQFYLKGDFARCWTVSDYFLGQWRAAAAGKVWGKSEIQAETECVFSRSFASYFSTFADLSSIHDGLKKAFGY